MRFTHPFSDMVSRETESFLYAVIEYPNHGLLQFFTRCYIITRRNIILYT